MKIRKKKYKCDFLRISRACNIDKNTIGSTKLEIDPNRVNIVENRRQEMPRTAYLERHALSIHSRAAYPVNGNSR